MNSVVSLIHSEEASVIHLNSVFSSKFTLPILMARRFGLVSKKIRVIISPHGELASSALQIKSFKKKGFFLLSRMGQFYRELDWHATSSQELRDIKTSPIARNSAVRLVPPPVCSFIPVPGKSREAKVAGSLKLIFLSRITEIKNLDYILRLLKTSGLAIALDIFGPIEAGDQIYWNKCLQEIAQLPTNIVVRYLGVVNADDVCSVISSYDLFVSPTKGENFGYAILESLAAGCPILISDQTPWNHIPRAAGECLSLSSDESWRHALKRFSEMDETTWKQSSIAARAFADNLEASQTPFTSLYDAALALDR